MWRTLLVPCLPWFRRELYARKVPLEPYVLCVLCVSVQELQVFLKPPSPSRFSHLVWGTRLGGGRALRLRGTLDLV